MLELNICLSDIKARLCSVDSSIITVLDAVTKTKLLISTKLGRVVKLVVANQEETGGVAWMQDVAVKVDKEEESQSAAA